MDLALLILTLATSLASLPAGLFSAPLAQRNVADLCVEMARAGDHQLYTLCKLLVKLNEAELEEPNHMLTGENLSSYYHSQDLPQDADSDRLSLVGNPSTYSSDVPAAYHKSIASKYNTGDWKRSDTKHYQRFGR